MLKLTVCASHKEIKCIYFDVSSYGTTGTNDVGLKHDIMPCLKTCLSRMSRLSQSHGYMPSMVLPYTTVVC